MEVKLPLDRMTTEEKLQVLEMLWDDLSREPSEIPSPDWHREVLEERKRLVESGQAVFLDLKDARERIRKEVR